MTAVGRQHVGTLSPPTLAPAPARPAPTGAAPSAEPLPRGPRALLARLAPSHRDGLALVLSSGLTSVVGLLYWVVAARFFAPEVLGVSSVAISTMMLLGGIAHLNMTYALLRFVPVAGRQARRLVLGGYLAGAGSATIVGAGFALGAPWWAPELVATFGQGPLVIFFVIATPLWSIFVMQDFVLTGIRRAGVVPLENFLFALLKIGLLIVASFVVVPGGIAISWVIATAVIVIGMNAWLLRAVPRHGAAAADRAVPISIGAIARFVRADYAGAVFWQAALFGMPVIVLARLGASDAAVYGITWTIAQAIYTVSSGMGQSMVAHSASDPGSLDAARRAMIRRALSLVVPAVAVIALGAPVILSVFGAHYAENGTATLVLAALSAVPNVITAATVNSARVRQRMGVLFAVPTSVALIVIFGSWVLMPRLGIVAVGLSWLGAQVLVAGSILVATAPWLPPLVGTRIEALRTAALLRRVRPFAAGQSGADWVIGQRLMGRSDSVVVAFGPPTGPGALLKASDSIKGREQLRLQSIVLRTIALDERLGAWRRLVPSILGDGDIGGSYYVLESMMPGGDGIKALNDPARRRTFSSSAVATISELHRCTSRPVRVGDEQLRRWVREPMAEVIAALPRSQRAAAAELESALVEQLAGRVLSTGRTHGDYAPENLLVDDWGRVVAIVDWCQAEEDGLPVLDVVCFLLRSENLTRGTELGTLVLDRLADARPTEHELLARAQRMLGGEVLDVGLLTLLGWLAHVAHNLRKSPTFAANPVWVRRNLVSVIREVPVMLERLRAGSRTP
ncbi:phosphotransferase [Pseudonocardia sp. GCM10023141]|uniref:phosphotransferase n=1 Tax=Pseudonocardia sp. GCM10023141 TaxID=3252653 RepID=UPI00360BE06D